MDGFKNKKILIFQQRRWGMNIGHPLAMRLSQEGCKFAAITFKRSTHNFILEQTDVKYELIHSNDDVMTDPVGYLGDDRFSLEEICHNLGIDSIWPIVMSLRNHVRSYGKKYYYSFKKNVSDEQTIEYVQAVYKYIKNIFDEFNPDVILTPNFVALPHIMFNLYAKQKGVPMIGVTDCKVRGLYIFSYSYKDDQGPFYDRVAKLNSGLVTSDNLDRAKEYVRQFKEKFILPTYAEKSKEKKSLLRIIRHELSPYYHSARWFIKRPINVVPSLGITADNRPPRIILRDHYAQKSYRSFMNSFKYYPLNNVGKYFYFPLQFQPEATIDVAAPYFSNQIETARQVAMSLPDDYTLVVKEHPAMVGLRPPSYIEKVSHLVNVKVIDYRISSEEVLKGAAGIISPNSTTIAEAAFLKKPVVQLGDLGTTLLLPNVRRCTDMTKLTTVLKEILQSSINEDDYDKKLLNYVAAAFDTGFDVDYINIWERGNSTEMEKLWQIYKKEIIFAISN